MIPEFPPHQCKDHTSFQIHMPTHFSAISVCTGGGLYSPNNRSLRRCRVFDLVCIELALYSRIACLQPSYLSLGTWIPGLLVGSLYIYA